MNYEAIRNIDPEIYELIKAEEERQYTSIRLIPSENYVSEAVLQASGSILTNKYSEGYPKKRYYEGQEYIDQIEEIAEERAKRLFGVEFANVQPYSGSPANLAVYLAFCKPGDPILGMSLDQGGHLTHGWNVSITGIYFKAYRYTVRRDTHRIDYDQVRDLAREHRPKIIWAGATAYPRIIDYKIFADIAQEVGAVFVADIAHIAGLIVGGVHPSPVPYADIITTTTHKTLRGPRGAMVMGKAKYKKEINKAVFPGLQGGPHNHTTAGIAVALKEASTDEFKQYATQIVKNAKVLAEELLSYGFDLVSGGTDNHLILIDLTNRGIGGRKAAQILNRAGIECNANTVPYDPRPPFDPSGLRIGTPAVTSRGMKEEEMKQIAKWINEVITNIENEDVIKRIRGEVREFCSKYPAPGILVK